MLADAYGGYNGVVAGYAITRAGRWSHARRKFVHAEKSAPEIAREAVARIDALFAVERQAKDVSAAERLGLRQKQSVPRLTELHQKLLIWKEPLLPKHPTADAVNYTLSQWDALTVFTTDGAVPIDNNVSEPETMLSSVSHEGGWRYKVAVSLLPPRWTAYCATKRL